MGSNEAVGVGIMALLAVPVALYLWSMRRSNQRYERYVELHAPLINNSDSRLDTAIRDMESGFHVCTGCGFENFQRAVICGMCGAAVNDCVAVTTVITVEHGGAVVNHGGAAMDNQQRRRRLRNRKQWTRQVDVDGNASWFRQGAIGGDEQANYVVRFTRNATIDSGMETRDSFALEMGEPSAEIDPEQASTRDDKPQVSSIRDVVDTLQRQVESHALVIEEVSRDDPSKPPLVQSPSDKLANSNNKDAAHIAAVRQRFANAQLVFPAKLVQFITQTTALQHDPSSASESGSVSATTSGDRLRVKVRRERLLCDSLETLASLPPLALRLGFRIAFSDENGIDAGAVYREWFLQLNEAIATPKAGIFTCVNRDDQSFYLNAHSRESLGESHLAFFLAAGRLLGRALLEGNVTGFHLALPLLKIILGLPVGFSDLEFYDPEVFKNLTWLLNNDGVEALGLDFTVTEKLSNGTVRVVELVPGGSDIDVTDANKREFVDRKFKYLLFGSVHEQLFAFLKGVYDVVPMELLMLFDAEELDYVLSGSDTIDVDDWERNTRYSADLFHHPVRRWFWTEVRAMTNEQRRSLLQFATGSTRVPLAGFSALTSYDGKLAPFFLQGRPTRVEEYIRSHACFNRLDLPKYQTKTQLRKMLRAIVQDESDSFGFTEV